MEPDGAGLREQAMKMMLRAQRNSFMRKKEFEAAMAASEGTGREAEDGASMWSESTLKLMQEAAADEAEQLADDADYPAETFSPPAASAPPPAAMREPAEEAQKSNAAPSATLQPFASKDEWNAVLARLRTLEQDNAELRTTVAALAASVDELKAAKAPAPGPPSQASPSARGLLPSGGFDLRAASAARQAGRASTAAAITDGATPKPVSPAPAPLTSRPTVGGPPLLSPPPAFAAAHLAAANGRPPPMSPPKVPTPPAAAPESASRDAEVARSLAAARSAAEDRVAKVDRQERAERAAARAAERALAESAATSDPAASVVNGWWTSQFGRDTADVVPFDRMRIAAESELGALSSVDVQLLRLELSDERGKLTKTALKRLLAGSIDGTSGHATVGSALKLLLESARAQLDRQVEVRMKQAASRSSRGKASGGPATPASSSSRSRVQQSPAERRIRLDFS